MKKGAVPKEAVGLDIATIMTVDSHSNQISTSWQCFVSNHCLKVMAKFDWTSNLSTFPLFQNHVTSRSSFTVTCHLDLAEGKVNN